MYIYIYTYTYVFVYVYMCVYIHIHTCTYIYIERERLYIHIYIYIYIYACIYIYIYIYILFIYSFIYRDSLSSSAEYSTPSSVTLRDAAGVSCSASSSTGASKFTYIYPLPHQPRLNSKAAGAFSVSVAEPGATWRSRRS